jgi:hypothetical protein
LNQSQENQNPPQINISNKQSIIIEQEQEKLNRSPKLQQSVSQQLMPKNVKKAKIAEGPEINVHRFLTNVFKVTLEEVTQI